MCEIILPVIFPLFLCLMASFYAPGSVALTSVECISVEIAGDEGNEVETVGHGRCDANKTK